MDVGRLKLRRGDTLGDPHGQVDDVSRVKTYEAIVKARTFPTVRPNLKVLIKSFNSLALDVKVLIENLMELDFSQSEETTALGA
jgi:hypothetical protein